MAMFFNPYEFSSPLTQSLATTPSGFPGLTSAIVQQNLPAATGSSLSGFGGPAAAGATQLAQSLATGDLWEKPLTTLRKVGGAAGGAAAGAALGSSVAPGPGTAIGGFLGSMFGGK